MTTILVSSGYGGNTRKPFVMMQAPEIDRPLQMSPTEARDLAANLLQAAEGTDSDAFLFEFLSKELGQPDPICAQLLLEFRKWREEHRNE
jgi:hypothetical protein